MTLSLKILVSALFISLPSIAQEVKVTQTVKVTHKVKVTFLKSLTTRYETKDTTIAYPIFDFGTKSLNDVVNNTVRSVFYELYNQSTSEPLKKVLKTLGKDGLTDLSYEEIIDDDKYFSFVLHQEWLAAYPTYFPIYYAFDKKSATLLTLDSLIQPEKKEAFHQLVLSKWKDTLSNYRKDLKTQLEKKEIDSSDYESFMEYIKDDCLSSFSPTNFKLDKDHLEIFFECPFPRIMRPMDPSGGISISLRSIDEYLRPNHKR